LAASFSVPQHDVKAFLFVQTNREVAQWEENRRAAILKNKDSQRRIVVFNQ
jgi:hypothetical protein